MVPPLKIGIILLTLSLAGNTPDVMLRVNKWLSGLAIWNLIIFRIFMFIPLASKLDLGSMADMISTTWCWDIRVLSNLMGGGGALVS